ncbi:uncharacterized protein TM35_000131500 [Trypanosoma theileri]|uniref:Uncharacterized protein n=1 Tax=Trypanosoma theileri TaxID=67003 RepID=A0A1X0NWQ5_9TRYP|nr:uncharacterized protein TM35_000131500 [Trypanosoma theileri]ORC89146.1 hypothetical protein TM35_000131500 [Trypanosoma theileri]
MNTAHNRPYHNSVSPSSDIVPPGHKRTLSNMSNLSSNSMNSSALSQSGSGKAGAASMRCFMVRASLTNPQLIGSHIPCDISRRESNGHKRNSVNNRHRDSWEIEKRPSSTHIIYPPGRSESSISTLRHVHFTDSQTSHSLVSSSSSSSHLRTVGDKIIMTLLSILAVLFLFLAIA